MPVIYMCGSTTCPSRLICYRHEAKPGWRQSWSEFEPEPGKDRCEAFMEIRRKGDGK